MLGLAQVRKEFAKTGTRICAILADGRDIHAVVVATPVYDPERTRVRS
jgi:glycine cleavage system aminomethyltransferase T